MPGSASCGFSSSSRGGDSIFGEFKGQPGFNFVFAGLLLFCCNELPRFGGDTGAWVYDRIIPIRCENIVPPDQRDRELLDKLYAERDGIFRKAVAALQEVIANGYVLDEPDCVRLARSEYTRSNSSILSFIAECLTPANDQPYADCCTSGNIYRVYKAWCADNANGYAQSDREFRRVLAEQLLLDSPDDLVEHRRGGNFFRGVTLTEDCWQRYRAS